MCRLKLPWPRRGITEAFDPEGEMPYYYAMGDPGRPNYVLFGPTGYGDRNTFYNWLEGGIFLPRHFAHDNSQCHSRRRRLCSAPTIGRLCLSDIVGLSDILGLSDCRIVGLSGIEGLSGL